VHILVTHPTDCRKKVRKNSTNTYEHGHKCSRCSKYVYLKVQVIVQRPPNHTDRFHFVCVRLIFLEQGVLPHQVKKEATAHKDFTNAHSTFTLTEAFFFVWVIASYLRKSFNKHKHIHTYTRHTYIHTKMRNTTIATLDPKNKNYNHHSSHKSTYIYIYILAYTHIHTGCLKGQAQEAHTYIKIYMPQQIVNINTGHSTCNTEELIHIYMFVSSYAHRVCNELINSFLFLIC